MTEQSTPNHFFVTSDGFERHLVDPLDWIHRRVESVTFSNATTMRRKNSIDFTVHSALPMLTDDRDSRLVPVAFIGKRELERLDVFDESGSALPVLTKHQNSELSTVILRGYLNLLSPELNDKLVDAQLRRIVELPELEARREADLFISGARSSSRRQNIPDVIIDGFLSTLNLFACNFLLVVVIKAKTGERRIVKFSNNKPVVEIRGENWKLQISSWLGWISRPYIFDTPLADECQSFHIELSCPDGLVFRDWGVRSGKVPMGQLDPSVILFKYDMKTQAAHLHYNDPRDSSMEAFAFIGISRNGWLTRSMFVSTFIFLLMATCVWRGSVAFTPKTNSASVLMALVALAAAILVRDNDHPMRARILSGPTCLTFGIVLLPEVGAMILLFNPGEPNRFVWLGLSVTALIFTIAVHIAYWRS